jgi:hypothetical protein
MARGVQLSRRRLLGALPTAAAGLALGAPFAAYTQAVTAPPKRLLIIHKPCGTVPASYDPVGTGPGFTFSRILKPFEPLKSKLVVPTGLKIMKKADTPGQDHGNGMVTFMTGGITITDPAFSAVIAERASIDQIFAGNAGLVGNSPFASIQLAADTRSDRDEVFTRVVSYQGKAAPLPPEQRPAAAFARLFAELLPGGSQSSTVEALARARARKKSVLDFVTSGLNRLSAQVNSDQKPKLESHLDAVRELERTLDAQATAASMACKTSDLAAEVAAADPTLFNSGHAKLGRAHLDIIRTAFACDLTRIATFQWAAGNSHVNLSTLAGTSNDEHHVITHSGSATREEDEAKIHEYYNQRMAEFFASMDATPDGDGSLLDNTLVVIWSEVHLGIHTFDNVPIQLLGGKGVGLAGGQVLPFAGRSTNDLWLAIAAKFGVPMTTFGDADKCTGPLTGVFT